MEPVAKRPKITDHFRVALKPHDSNVKNWPSLKNPLRANQNAGNTSDHKSSNGGTKQASKHQNLIQQQLKLQPKPLQPLSQQQHIHHSQPQHQQQNRSKENIEVITINDDDADESITQTIGNKLKIHDASFSINDSSINTNDSKISIDNCSIKSFLSTKRRSDKSSNRRLSVKRLKPNKYFPPPGLVSPIVDHDADLLDTVWNEPHYAWDSFEYDKTQEIKFRTRKYLNDGQTTNLSDITNLPSATMATHIAQPQDRQQQYITPRIRARLVDWLVDIQNDFRLDHEPLYLAVKIADQYLMRKPVLKKDLELLYMTSIFISVKFDYRPNFLTISELIQEFAGRYEKKQVVRFELDILSTLDFNIRYPLSYGFLRRFARCTSSHVQTLTLARYILESSLLDYDMIDNLESKMAAACLLLSNRMLRVEQEWGDNAEFYTGYKQQDLESLVAQLNRMISKPPDRKLSAVRRKYSNEVFMSVANIEPLIDT